MFGRFKIKCYLCTQKPRHSVEVVKKQYKKWKLKI